MTTPAPGRPPLRGVRVLDLSDEAVVLAARYLADLGAEVIRVESRSGDRLRRRPPFVDGEPGLERSLAHLHYNGGKRSVALALDDREAWELVDRLAANVDLIIAPLERPPAAQAFFDPERLLEAHPRVGLVDMVFRRGEAVPIASDLIAVAAGGLLYCNGFPDRAPDYPVGKLAYKQAAHTALAAGIALLLRARRQGVGGSATVSLQEATMSTTIQAANQNMWRWYGKVARRGQLSVTTIGPTGLIWVETGGVIYKSQDQRWVVFGIWPTRWDGFATWFEEVTGSRKFLEGEWTDPARRAGAREELNEAISAICAALPRDELVRRGQEFGLLVTPINQVDDIARDEHLNARGVFPMVHHPALGRDLPRIRGPFRSSLFEPPIEPAPALGEHTSWALREIAGLSDEEFERACATGLAETSTALAVKEVQA